MLIQCLECGHDLSLTAEACGHCGHPYPSHDELGIPLPRQLFPKADPLKLAEFLRGIDRGEGFEVYKTELEGLESRMAASLDPRVLADTRRSVREAELRLWTLRYGNPSLLRIVLALPLVVAGAVLLTVIVAPVLSALLDIPPRGVGTWLPIAVAAGLSILLVAPMVVRHRRWKRREREVAHLGVMRLLARHYCVLRETKVEAQRKAKQRARAAAQEAVWAQSEMRADLRSIRERLDENRGGQGRR